MNSSQVNIAMKRLWAQGPINKPISATKLRKATTSHVRVADPGSRDQLAKHMSHDPKTADKYYNVFSSEKLATPTCKLISSVMEDRHPSSSHNERIEKTLSYYDSEEELFGGPPSPLYTQDLIDWPVEQEQGEGVQAEKEEQPMEEQAIKQEQDVEEQEEEQTSKPHGRRSFTNEESTSLIRLCGEVLKSGKVNKSSTQQALLSSEEGRHLARTIENKFEGIEHWKKIVDRVHLERKNRKKLFPQFPRPTKE